jgi:hypothetical protein
MTQNMLFCFTNIYAVNLPVYFRQQQLHQMPYFSTFLPNAVAIESIKKYMRKSRFALAPIRLMKLTPSVTITTTLYFLPNLRMGPTCPWQAFPA